MLKLFIQPQISPQYIQVPGPVSGTFETVLNHEGELILPAAETIIYKPEPWDVYSANPEDRTLLYAVTADGNTDAEIFAQCPGLRVARERIVRRACEAANKHALGIYVESESERRTWPQQRDEATRKIMGGSQVFPTAEKITQVSGESIDQFLQAVWDRILPYDETVLTNIGTQRIKIKAIYDATTVEGVLAVVW